MQQMYTQAWEVKNDIWAILNLKIKVKFEELV